MKKLIATAVIALTLTGCTALQTPVPKDWYYVPGRGYVSKNPSDFNYRGNTWRHNTYKYNNYKRNHKR